MGGDQYVEDVDSVILHVDYMCPYAGVHDNGFGWMKRCGGSGGGRQLFIHANQQFQVHIRDTHTDCIRVNVRKPLVASINFASPSHLQESLVRASDITRGPGTWVDRAGAAGPSGDMQECDFLPLSNDWSTSWPLCLYYISQPHHVVHIYPVHLATLTLVVWTRARKEGCGNNGRLTVWWQRGRGAVGIVGLELCTFSK